MSPLLGLWVLMSAHGHSWVLISIGPWLQEGSLVLVRANGPMAVGSWQLLSSPLVLIAPWRQVHENSWLLMSDHEQSWALMSTHQHSWAFISSQEQPWVFLITIEHSWAAMNTHELGAMEQWALMGPQVQSWVWHHHKAMSAHQHSWVLMAPCHHTHECSWVLMSTHERLWELMSTHNRSWVLNCFIKQ